MHKGTNGLAAMLKETQYYPMGMEMSQLSVGSGTTNKYLYNGKELQDDFGLYWYDYGARFYDPMIGRWHTIDPKAEAYQSYSPYNYTLNNPINNTDPNGMWVETKDGYHTDDADDILKFFTSLFGIGPGNQPKNEEQARSQASARKALKNVEEGVERLYEAQQEAIALVPGGVLLNKIMDSQTGYESDNNFGAELGFEIASVYLPGVKFAKGPLESVVKLSDNVVEFTQGKKELAKRVRAYLPEGFRRVAGLSKTEDIFTNGKVFITPDNTSHIGGTWKAAKKIEHLGSKTKRLGTYDENFVRIGD